MMAHDEMLDNVAVYALGVLPDSEARAVAEHLQTCDECREEYRQLSPAVTAIGRSAEVFEAADSPGPLLKARIMREIRRAPEVSGHIARPPSYLGLLAAACLVFAIAAGLLDWTLRRHVERDQAQIAAQSALLAQQSATLQRQSATIGDLANSKRYAFGPGTLLVNGPRLYIAMRALPPPPKGKVYQAWTLPKGSKRMAPSVTFEPGAGGATLLRLPESAQRVTAVAVSVEPAGGSLQPTSKPIAVAVL